MSDRLPKINTLIKKHVAEIMARELDLKPGVFLTLAKVDTSPDLRYAQIFVSVFPESEVNYAMTALQNEKHAIQKKLHAKMHVKILPQIRFTLDLTEARADEIEKIINSF